MRVKKRTYFWLRRVLELAGAAAVICGVWAVLFCIFDLAVMPAVTKHGKELEIPDLFEMTFDIASRKSAASGFKIVLADSRYDEYYQPGIVIEQSPAPFTRSKMGRKIRVIVSEGEQLFPMPDVVGISEKEAVFKLEAHGITVSEDSAKYIFSDYYPDGVVAEQSPPPAAMLKRGYEAVLTVSMGPLPRKFIVPDLYTLDLKEISHLIRKAGLTMGEVEIVHFPQADSGVVVEQSPEPGVQLDYLSRIDLKVSGAEREEEE